MDSESHSAYPPLIERHFPNARHIRHPGGKGAVTGQGELKKLHWDPLFCINHQLAMSRANISRLFRRSWNTPKKVDRLADHLDIFTHQYNCHRRPRKKLNSN